MRSNLIRRPGFFFFLTSTSFGVAPILCYLIFVETLSMEFIKYSPFVFNISTLILVSMVISRALELDSSVKERVAFTGFFVYTVTILQMGNFMVSRGSVLLQYISVIMLLFSLYLSYSLDIYIKRLSWSPPLDRLGDESPSTTKETVADQSQTGRDILLVRVARKTVVPIVSSMLLAYITFRFEIYEANFINHLTIFSTYFAFATYINQLVDEQSKKS